MRTSKIKWKNTNWFSKAGPDLRRATWAETHARKFLVAASYIDAAADLKTDDLFFFLLLYKGHHPYNLGLANFCVSRNRPGELIIRIVIEGNDFNEGNSFNLKKVNTWVDTYRIFVLENNSVFKNQHTTVFCLLTECKFHSL